MKNDRIPPNPHPVKPPPNMPKPRESVVSIPRYKPNPLWIGMPIVDDKEGKLCEYRDYVKLEAENARLKAEVERLRKAGYERVHDMNQIGGLQEEIASLKDEVEQLQNRCDFLEGK